MDPLTIPLLCSGCQLGDLSQLLNPSMRLSHTFIMASTSSANDAPQITNNAPLVTSSPITNPHVPNPCSYPPFDLRLIPTYTNCQLQYYHLSGAMLSIDRAVLKTKMVECKADLELLDWDGNTCENTTISTPLVTSAFPSSSCTLSLNDNSNVNS